MINLLRCRYSTGSSSVKSSKNRTLEVCFINCNRFRGLGTVEKLIFREDSAKKKIIQFAKCI